MYGFLLGREFKISVAEILSVFPNAHTIYQSKEILILDNISKEEILEKISHIGWTIKVTTIEKTTKSIQDALIEKAPYEGKFRYGLNLFWERKSLKDILMKVKKHLRSNDISARFTNKDFKNLNAAQIIGENLVKRESDFNFIFTKEITYFGQTIWIQDINSYGERDYSKDRDMQIGMLPPKLSQMMINLSGGRTIYDPFVGLWTVLIESLYMGNAKVYGSDLNEKMVNTSLYNCKEVAKKLNLEADIQTEKLNAKFINESPYFDKWVDWIVTEGYLGEIMTKKNIAIDRIEKQRESLEKIYSAFFKNLSKLNYSWNIVISFPFWEIRGKYYYFEEIYKILEKYCEIQRFFPEDYLISATKAWSLLYKRDSQLVWREIFKLKMK